MENNRIALGFSALAKDIRLQIADALGHAGSDGLTAGELARRFDCPPSTLSFHLSTMVEAGLLRGKRLGRETNYALRTAGLRNMLLVLARLESSRDPHLREQLERLLPLLEDEEVGLTAAYNVAFICTRNSARSIMAEAILESVGRGKFRAYSAGTEPAEAPMPEVIERLERLGHDVSALRSKHWSELTGPDAPRMDFVLTLCDIGQGEECPDFGPNPVTAAWPFPDPAKFTGSPAERTTLLNELYGMIRRRLEAFVNLPIASLDQLSLAQRLTDLADAGAYRR